VIDPGTWPPGGVPAAVRLVRVHVPLRGAHRASHGSEQVRDVILVRWTRPDGVHGWSECPTLSSSGYATETTDAAWAGLTSRMVPALLEGGVAFVAGLVAASAALLDAALDAQLHAEGRSLVAALAATQADDLAAGPAPAPAPARRLPRCAVLADLGASPAELAARAASALEAGAAMVKVKIAPGHDLAVLREVLAAAGGAPVAADANGSYPDLASLRQLDALGLAYLEQPVPAGWSWDDLSQLRAALATPVALDESLVSLDAVNSALRAGALDVVSLKPARLGGVRAAAEALRLAGEAGADAFVGGMLELGIGRATAAALAAQPGCTLPTDLGPSSAYVDADICEPIVVDRDGLLVVPEGVGIGRVPDEADLLARRVDEVTLGPGLP